jgi:hypothetical protein
MVSATARSAGAARLVTRRAKTEAVKHSALESGRRLARWQQAEQFLPRQGQLADLLAARFAAVQVRERYRTLAPGQHAERQLRRHLSELAAVHLAYLGHSSRIS